MESAASAAELLLPAFPLQDLQQYLDAAMLRASSPEEAYRKLDELAGRHVERLRRLTKQLQDARLAHDSEATKAAISAYEEALEGYIPGGPRVGPSAWVLLQTLRSAGADLQSCPAGSGTGGLHPRWFDQNSEVANTFDCLCQSACSPCVGSSHLSV